MRFCTVINCMDGRVQLPVIWYLQRRFQAEYVDSITEPGPNCILANQTDRVAVESILERLHISVERHHSAGVAVVGHHDCAGNPAGKEEQNEQTQSALTFLRRHHSDVPMIGLWLDGDWRVVELGD